MKKWLLPAVCCIIALSLTGCRHERPEVTDDNTYVDSLPEPSDEEMPLVADNTSPAGEPSAQDADYARQKDNPPAVAEKRVVAHSEDGYVNIRQKATVSSDTIGRLYVGGEGALYLGTSGEWYHVRYHGKEGYVKSVFAAIDSTAKAR